LTGKVYVAEPDFNSVAIIDEATNQVETRLKVGLTPNSLAVVPNTERVYIGGSDGTVTEIDGHAEVTRLAGAHVGVSATSLAVSPRTNRLYVSNLYAATVSIFDGSSTDALGEGSTGASLMDPPSQPYMLNGTAVNPVTGHVFVTNRQDFTLSILSDEAVSPAQIVPTATINVGENPLGVAVNTRTKRAYVANFHDNNVTVLDASNDQVLGTIPVGAFPAGVTVSENRNQIYVANTGDKTISVIDGGSQAVVATIPLGGISPWRLALDPLTEEVYGTAPGNGDIFVVDGPRNALIAGIGGLGQATDVAVSPQRTAVNLPITDAEKVMVLQGGTANHVTGSLDAASPRTVAVNDTLGRLYVGNNLGAISVIDLATSEQRALLPVGSGVGADGVIALAVNENTGRTYALSYNSRTLSVLDSSNHVSAIGTVGYAPSGLAVSSTTSKVYVTNWNDNTVSVFQEVTVIPETVSPEAPTVSAP
jgi:YVTN family beta-propeller protein